MSTERQIEKLPLSVEVMTEEVWRALMKSAASLAELKGSAKSIPNQRIFLDTLSLQEANSVAESENTLMTAQETELSEIENIVTTLSLQEAKDSSEIENIVTTHDKLFAMLVEPDGQQPSQKEAYSYVPAISLGLKQIKKEKILRMGTLSDMQSQIVGNNAGVRKLPGTVLKDQHGHTVYTPPQHESDILPLLGNLLDYINHARGMDDGLHPLVRMAIIHHQFESIHPFYDGNGRVGRIVNILYLIMSNLINVPILYLSRYIVSNRTRYYELLRAVNQQPNAENWQTWIIYMLRAVEKTAQQSLETIEAIRRLRRWQERQLLENRFYNEKLLATLFRYPCCSRKMLVRELNIARGTAINYAKKLQNIGIVEPRKIGRKIYYVNTALLHIFTELPKLNE